MKTTQHQTKHHMQEKRNKLSLEKALQVIGPLLGTTVGVSAADGPVGAVPAQTRQPLSCPFVVPVNRRPM